MVVGNQSNAVRPTMRVATAPLGFCTNKACLGLSMCPPSEVSAKVHQALFLMCCHGICIEEASFKVFAFSTQLVYGGFIPDVEGRSE